MSSAVSHEDGIPPETARVISAVRLLSILDTAGKPIGRRDKNTPVSAVKVLEAQLTLHALDFWVRNPDYLAWEMLNLYELGRDDAWFTRAEAVFSGDGPDLHRVPMMRYIFGAYEDLSDAMATLSSCDLVALRRHPRAKTTPNKHSYYLLQNGAVKAAEISKHDVLGWFHERASLVAAVAGDRRGSQLKAEQHKVRAYHNAKLKELIPPIYDEVAARFSALGSRAHT